MSINMMKSHDALIAYVLCRQQINLRECADDMFPRVACISLPRGKSPIDCRYSYFVRL